MRFLIYILLTTFFSMSLYGQSQFVNEPVLSFDDFSSAPVYSSEELFINISPAESVSGTEVSIPDFDFDDLSMEASSGGLIVGGGGNAVVCRNKSGTIYSASFLDIYEGIHHYGLTLPPTQVPYLEYALKQVEKMGHSAGPRLQKLMAQMVKLIDIKKKLLRGESQLKKFDDSLHLIFPRESLAHGCSIEQVANFTRDGEFLVEGEIWDQLGELDKAALLLHEALYWFSKNFGAENSVVVRKSVAHTFASQSLEPVLRTESAIPKGAYVCSVLMEDPFDPITQFWIYPTDNGLILEFEYFFGTPVLSHSTLHLTEGSVAEFLNSDYLQLRLGIETGVLKGWRVNFAVGVTTSSKELGGKSISIAGDSKRSRNFECTPWE